MSKINLQDKIQELRDLLNYSICYKQGAWERKDGGDWSKLWAAVDNIEDTQLAIDEYSSLKKFSRLAVYGLLQAMVVQQNAISHLEEAIKIQKPNWPKEYPGLSQIRDIRVETVGHPTSTKRDGDNISYTSISHTNKIDILEYEIWFKNNFQHKTINIKDIINVQHNLLIKEIDRIMKKIEEDETLHKKQFHNQSLTEILKTTSHNIQKLWPFERDRTYSEMMFESLCNTFNKFKAEIKKRYGFNDFSECINIPGVVRTVEKIEKLLPRIKKMLPMGKDVDVLDLELYVESLNSAFGELKTMAKEIDDEFANKRI